MIIENIEQIEHPQLVKDIKSLCLELTNHIAKKPTLVKDEYLYNDIIRNHILGINRPMCISDGIIYSIGDGEFKIELLVNYQIMHVYKPTQKSFTDIQLFCKVSKEILRDYKINELI